MNTSTFMGSIFSQCGCNKQSLHGEQENMSLPVSTQNLIAADRGVSFSDARNLSKVLMSPLCVIRNNTRGVIQSLMKAGFSWLSRYLNIVL